MRRLCIRLTKTSRFWFYKQLNLALKVVQNGKWSYLTVKSCKPNCVLPCDLKPIQSYFPYNDTLQIVFYVHLLTLLALRNILFPVGVCWKVALPLCKQSGASVGPQVWWHGSRPVGVVPGSLSYSGCWKCTFKAFRNSHNTCVGILYHNIPAGKCSTKGYPWNISRQSLQCILYSILLTLFLGGKVKASQPYLHPMDYGSFNKCMFVVGR